MEEIQETGEFPAGALRIISWQAVNEVHRSKLTGYQNIVMKIYTKGVTPECFNRGPVPVSPGFPIKAFGNDRC
jgi:hypothetical protein